MIDDVIMNVPRGNGVVVMVIFAGIDDATGLTAQLTRKANRRAADTDAKTYDGAIISDDGIFSTSITIPSTDNGVVGKEWYRVDVINNTGEPRTAVCGPLIIEPV